MIHFFIPLGILASIKLFFVAHGLTISVAAIEAGWKAHRRGEDVIDAALQAGATRAAAVLLSDSLKRYA